MHWLFDCNVTMPRTILSKPDGHSCSTVLTTASALSTLSHGMAMSSGLTAHTNGLEAIQRGALLKILTGPAV
eukprot:3555177-Amphidinium_carterae.1